jgi:soluble lytic murein transglycosylase-like protein
LFRTRKIQTERGDFMKWILTLACVCALACAPAPVRVPSALTPKLLAAIRQVESGGNDNAVGDQGRAIGPYQVWEIYWKDAVEYDKTIGGSYKDCYNPEYAKRVVIAYLSRYAPKNATAEDLARIHNGGPSGHKKSATIKYWKKVEKEMKK